MPNKCFVPACKSGYLSNTKILKSAGKRERQKKNNNNNNNNKNKINI